MTKKYCEIKGHILLFRAILFIVVIGLFIAYTPKSCINCRNLMKYNIELLYSSSLKLYNKSCGVEYWRSTSNFQNKDDIDFFTIISKILVPVTGEIIIVEFGANIGQFSEAILRIPHEIPYVVHSIEPLKESFTMLRNRSMKFIKGPNDQHFQYNLGISDRPGHVPIYSSDILSEGASLGRGLNWNFRKLGDVNVLPLPTFIKIGRIKTPLSFIKIDVEGFEPEVIFGMHLETNADIFPLFSFETGGTWRDDRSFLAKNITLKSFIAMLDGFGYDSFFISKKFLLPLNGVNWDDSFDGFARSPNVLSVLRYSESWKRLLVSRKNVILNICMRQSSDAHMR